MIWRGIYIQNFLHCAIFSCYSVFTTAISQSQPSSGCNLTLASIPSNASKLAVTGFLLSVHFKDNETVGKYILDANPAFNPGIFPYVQLIISISSNPASTQTCSPELKLLSNVSSVLST